MKRFLCFMLLTILVSMQTITVNASERTYDKQTIKQEQLMQNAIQIINSKDWKNGDEVYIDDTYKLVYEESKEIVDADRRSSVVAQYNVDWKVTTITGTPKTVMNISINALANYNGSTVEIYSGNTRVATYDHNYSYNVTDERIANGSSIASFYSDITVSGSGKTYYVMMYLTVYPDGSFQGKHTQF